ncbi:hypothetical protein ACN28S_36230 [Cystobacter fuscus]
MASIPTPTYAPVAQKKQAYTNSCGAASLLCAATELGSTHLGNQPLDTRTNASETQIYQATSGAYSMGNPENSGYSFPDRIVATGRALGLNGHVHMTNSLPSQVIKYFGGNVVNNLHATGVPIEEGPERQLAANQRRLRVVVVTANVAGRVPVMAGLHYIMERPDGSIMDPASGRNYNNIHELNQEMAQAGLPGVGRMMSTHYANSGISVVLTG